MLLKKSSSFNALHLQPQILQARAVYMPPFYWVSSIQHIWMQLCDFPRPHAECYTLSHTMEMINYEWGAAAGQQEKIQIKWHFKWTPWFQRFMWKRWQETPASKPWTQQCLNNQLWKTNNRFQLYPCNSIMSHTHTQTKLKTPLKYLHLSISSKSSVSTKDATAAPTQEPLMFLIFTS